MSSGRRLPCLPTLARQETHAPPPDTHKLASDAPYRTLNLLLPKGDRSPALGVVFEADPNVACLFPPLPGNVIGASERRLSPLESILLVKACSGSSDMIDNVGD